MVVVLVNVISTWFGDMERKKCSVSADWIYVVTSQAYYGNSQWKTRIYCRGELIQLLGL